jgi:hypothetical protein
MTTNDTRVIAVQVRQVDPPQFIAEDVDDLLERFPGEWGGEQCDNCGCCAYMIEPIPGKTIGLRPAPLDLIQNWQVRCCGEPDTADRYEADGADPEQVEAVRNGCGTTYPLRRYHESQVAF